MSLEQTIDNLQIRNANMVTFVGTSNTMVDTTTGRIQTKGIQHNSNVITDVSGPHGRVAPTLKKFPEIIFEEGKFDYNDSTNTYVQAGYTVSANATHENRVHEPWVIFNDKFTANDEWQISINLGGDRYSETDGTYNSGVDLAGSTVADQTYNGDWVQVSLPQKIKLSHMNLGTGVDYGDSRMPEEGVLLGSNDGTAWSNVLAFGQTSYQHSVFTKIDVNSSDYYLYYRMIWLKITAGDNSTHRNRASLALWELYGYEEDPPAGDHSVDTTFVSRFNNPQTTGVHVLVDGVTGVGTNQISGGPDPSGNQSTYVTDGKYWTLNGTLTSNITVEANTFLEGDQPHSVSVWFNSSNLEANTANTCVFSVSDQEKLDSVNLDLQSNTWHNLTYAYQGEGGSRVTYLDGRKVAEDQAEDTFGDYPPFAMTGYSQGGYVVSASDEDTTYPLWRIFAGDSDFYVSSTSAFPGGVYTSGSTYNLGTNSGGSATDNGHWIKLAVPYKLKISHVNIDARTGYEPQAPKNFKFYGSNDDTNWEQIGPSFSNEAPQDDGTSYYTLNSTKAYKYIGLVVTETVGNGNGRLGLQQLKFYGHRENDLVRLPDPTNVLKYPHIAMTGPAQRGYVASAKNFLAGREPWEAFNGYVYGTHPSHPNDNGWMSNGLEFTNSTGAYNQNGDTFTDTASGTHTGPWIRLETPHKLQLSSFDISNGNNAERRMKSIVILGSDDASVSTGWSLIYTNTNITNAQDVNGLVVNSTQAFKYHMIVVKAVSGGGTGSTGVWVAELQLYGTGVDSVPIQIGGGNIDKVANFRVYDKFIDQNQALEIWDAQKDEFGRAKSSMTLQKGRLGIGTTEPEGRLAVLDEPHNLEEFPPRALTGYKNYFEGHGEFCVNSSSNWTSSGGWHPYYAFDKSYYLAGTRNTWESRYNDYDASSPHNYAGSFSLGGYFGEYIDLKMPYSIKLNNYSVSILGNWTSYAPKDFMILASNDSKTWDQIHSVSGQTWEGVNGVTQTINYNVNDTKYYNHFALLTTALFGTSRRVNIEEIRYFGTREQGQSVLHDGQLTLTKNLDVPRIGPPLDADDTPRRDRLVVEYNTSTNPTFEGAVRDTSGRGNDGVFYGGASYDASAKAFVFDGTDDYLEHDANFIDGINTHTMSIWVNPDAVGNNWRGLIKMGDNSNGNSSGLYFAGDGNNGKIAFTTYDNNLISTTIPNVGNWIHVCGTYDGGTRRLYLDGVQIATDTATINLTGTSKEFIIGASGPTSEFFDGAISNFKLYDCALTASEVKTLYDMGRNGSVVNPQPLHIAAPLYAPGASIQTVAENVHDIVTYPAASSRTITPLTIRIKPKFANSKILLHWMINAEFENNNVLLVYRNGVKIGYNTSITDANWVGLASSVYDGDINSTIENLNISWIDTPGTTENLEYSVVIRAANSGGGYPIYFNRTASTQITGAGTTEVGVANYERTVSFKSATEIAQ